MSIYLVEIGEDSFELSQKSIEKLSVSKLTDENFHILYNNKTHRIKIVEKDFRGRTLKVEVNGNNYSLKISDGHDEIVKKMGLLIGSSQKAKDIKAPMPGLIVDVMVVKGQEVVNGTPLIVLSAMKMENIILAQGDGTIKTINVKKGDTVDKGEVIIEIE